MTLHVYVCESQDSLHVVAEVVRSELQYWYRVPGLVSRGSSWVSINCAFEDFPFDDFVDFVASVNDAVSETMASKVDASAERKDDDLNEDDFL